LARPIADFVVSFGPNGKVRGHAIVSELTKRGSLAAQLQKDGQVLNKTQEEIEAENVVTKAPDGKLILAEEIQMGHVGASACSHYRCFV
jgi:hypothetical protein